MNLKPWSVQNEIAKRVQKESWYEFWQNLEPTKLIELKKVDVKKDSIWWANFIKTMLHESKLLIKEIRP